MILPTMLPWLAILAAGIAVAPPIRNNLADDLARQREDAAREAAAREAARSVQAVGPASPNDVEFTLLPVDGAAVTGVMVRLDAEGASVRGADGAERRVAWSGSLGAVSASASGAVDEGTGMMALADGQRIPGRAEMTPSGWRWRHPMLGSIDPASDSLRWISFEGAAPPAPSADADVVLLRTGDRLEGFVARIADPLPLEPRTPGAPTLVPLEGVASISFVSRDAAPAAGTRRVWTLDGLVVDGRSVRFDGGSSVVIEGASVPGASELVIPIDRILAVAGDRRAEALSSRPMSPVETPQSADRRYTLTPPERLRWPGERPSRPLGDAALALDLDAWPMAAPALAFDGPAILRVEIREPAVLTALVRLPRDRRPWGRFELTVRSGDGRAGPFAFDDRHLVQELRLPVVPPAVEFEITDTGGGPVQDGVIIERALLLRPADTAPTPAPAASPSAPRSDR